MTLPIQDPTLAAEGLGVPPRRHGFLRSVLRERKAAVIGLAIIVFFILLSVIAPYISPYSATAQTCAVYAPPSPKAFAVTFDDAYRSVIELGFPILSRLGVPGTVFVPTSHKYTISS